MSEGLPLGTRLRYTAGRYLPFLKITPAVDRKAIMNLRPLHNNLLKWEKHDTGEMVLTVPINKEGNIVIRTLSKWYRLQDERHVELDEVGAFVWEMCDGSNTVESIVQKTGRHFKMDRREAEVSVPMFLQMLYDRKFIAFYKKTRQAGERRVENECADSR